VISTALACGSPGGNDGGSGGSGGGSGGSGGSGGGTGGSGGSGGGSGGSGGSGGGTGGSGGSGGGTGGTGGTGGSGGGSGGAGGGAACTPSAAPIILDAGCATALPSPGACGGALPGTWCYTSYCLNPAVLPAVTQVCAGAYYSSVVGTVNGTTAFTGTAAAGAVNRNATTSLAVSVDFPPSCYNVVLTDCPAIQGALAFAGITATCNTSTDGGCLCGRTLVDSLNETGSYTTSGSVLNATLADGGVRTYEYCVQSNTMRYRETTANPAERSVGTLTR
jgi:hypothetical protein